MSLRIAPALVLSLLTAFEPACSLGAKGDTSAHSAELEQAWKLYQSDSPDWPAARDRWIALGADDKETLVLNLIADMNRNATRSRGTARGLEPGWKRGEAELLHVDAATAVPILITTLRTWKDTVALEAVSDSLVQFGAGDALIAALDQPEKDDSVVFRSVAMRTLVGIGGDRAITRAGQEAKSGTDPIARGSAVAALGRARHSDKTRAATALLAALDPSPTADPAADKVLGALEALDEPKAAPAIALFHRDARARKDEKNAARAAQVLRKLTGVTVPGDDPELWIREAARMVEGNRP